MKSTHSARLERWLGRESVEALSASIRGWYGPPLPVGNVPGIVYATGDGDFVGAIKGGYFASAADYVTQRGRRIARNVAKRQRAAAHMGFSSLSDLISEATSGGKQQYTYWQKTSSGTARALTLWPASGRPGAGTNGSAIPGGSVPTNATTGAIPQSDPSGSDTLHLVAGSARTATANPNILILYDRLFHASSVLHTTTGNQAISGVPTRYTGTAAVGTFITLELINTLGTTAHNVTITYVDQDGNAAEDGSAQPVRPSAGVQQIVLAATTSLGGSFQWFYRLNAGDSGARNVTNIAFSAVSSGQSQLVQGKALMAIPLLGSTVSMMLIDGLAGPFPLVEVKAGACLALLVLNINGAANTYHGDLTFVSG